MIGMGISMVAARSSPLRSAGAVPCLLMHDTSLLPQRLVYGIQSCANVPGLRERAQAGWIRDEVLSACAYFAAGFSSLPGLALGLMKNDATRHTAATGAIAVHAAMEVKPNASMALPHKNTNI